ncbi:hypothetical protein PSD17_17500 [Pseudonocardia sp. D17]|nr:hypothetical protein PSD17_17500 [Pseudonocardia sp. D17]
MPDRAERATMALMTSNSVETDLRGAHPLAPAVPLLRDTLLGIADEATHTMIVTDENGRILWRDGEREVPHADGRTGLVGTLHAWTCAAAPIHEPEDGRLIGVVDVTGMGATFHPTTLMLTAAAARLAENQLATLAAARDERMRARHLARLVQLRDEPGALLTPAGRVLAAQPLGWLPDRIDLPEPSGAALCLGLLGEAVLEPLTEGWLLRLRRPGSGARLTTLSRTDATHRGH